MKLLGRLLWLTVLLGAFYDAVEFIKPGLSTASLTVTDLLLTLVYLVWLFQMSSGRLRLPRLSQYKALYLFIIMLLVPIPVGLMQGRLLQTVLRDARAPYYFVLSLVVMSFATDEGAFKKLLKAFLVVGALSLAVDYAVYIFKIPVATSLAFQELTTGRVSRHFGYASTFVLLLVCILLLVNYLFIMPDGRKRRKKAIAGLLLFVAGLCLTLIRGLFLGMVSGLVVAVLMQKGKAKVPILVGMVLLIGCMALLLHVASTEMTGTILRIPVVERYVSIVDPSVTTYNSRGSAEGRIQAPGMIMKYGIQGHPVLGVGYGEFRKPRGQWDVVDPLLTLTVHSIMAWMLYKTGYVGTLVLLVCLLAFFIRGVRSFRLSAKRSWHKLGYGVASAFLAAIFVAGAGANTMFGSERCSPLVAIMIGLLLCKPGKAEGVETQVDLMSGSRPAKKAGPWQGISAPGMTPPHL
jgi:uncharacterized membrane protein